MCRVSPSAGDGVILSFRRRGQRVQVNQKRVVAGWDEGPRQMNGKGSSDSLALIFKGLPALKLKANFQFTTLANKIAKISISGMSLEQRTTMETIALISQKGGVGRFRQRVLTLY